jgi:hypothetical protein
VKYLAQNGIVKEIEVDSSLSVRYESRGDRHVHIPPTIDSDSDLSTIILHFMGVVATAPRYIDLQSIPWILSTLDAFHAYICSDEPPEDTYHSLRGIHDFAMSGTRWHQSDEGIPPRPTFVDLSRRFFCLELLAMHLYGGRVGTNKFFDQSRQEETEGITPMLSIKVDSGRGDLSCRAFPMRATDFLHKKSFKTDMTQQFFKGAEVVFVVPDDGLLTLNAGGSKTVYSRGTAIICEIERFYLSQGGWGYDVTSVALPESLAKGINYEFPFAPIMMAKQSIGSYSGVNIGMYVPLDWISHIVERPRGLLSLDHSIKRVESYRYPKSSDSAMDSAAESVVSAKISRDLQVAREMFSRLR